MTRTFTEIDVAQRSPEWYTARLGRVTSSCANDMLTKLKNGGEAAGRRNLRVRLALERITGKSMEREFQSQAMNDGIEREFDAQGAYEAATGHLLMTSGFLAHFTLMAGASLDGHIGDFEGIAEIKSPIPSTHLEYLRTGVIPLDYQRQIWHQLFVSGAEWCDWLSYQPDFPEALRVKLVRVWRKDVDLAAYELELRTFLTEVEKEVASINALASAGVGA